MSENPLSVNVMLWGTNIGKLLWSQADHCAVFQFSDAYLSMPYDMCPLTHRKSALMGRSFLGNRQPLYQGLPEFLADALPDKWGSALFDQWLTDNSVPIIESLPLMKLSYIGKRAMGALEFVPEFQDTETEDTVDISSLADLAAKIYKDRSEAVITQDEALTLKKLIYLGTSAGGARPKAVVAFNPTTNEFRSGQADLPDGFKHYIIKFKEDNISPTTEIEMVYHEMAKEAGITMMPCFLRKVDGLNHFVTERFDRQDGRKSFTQTLAALMPGADDYMKLCWLADSLRLPQEDRDQLFIRMVFNFMAGVSDDHNKNFSFIMDPSGAWRLSPAYDVTFTANVWQDSSAAVHSLGVMGKKSSLTIDDFLSFAEDFVEKPKQKIARVQDAVATFREKCAKYDIDDDVTNKIEKVLQSLSFGRVVSEQEIEDEDRPVRRGRR